MNTITIVAALAAALVIAIGAAFLPMRLLMAHIESGSRP